MEPFGSTSQDEDSPETKFWNDGLPIVMKPGTSQKMNKKTVLAKNQSTAAPASKTSSWFSLKPPESKTKEVPKKEQSDLYNYF